MTKPMTVVEAHRNAADALREKLKSLESVRFPGVQKQRAWYEKAIKNHEDAANLFDKINTAG